jgi:tetratricopeptide (TPR) repeat protein
MSQSQQRGILLLQQGRFDLADREFRRALSEEPDDPIAHAYLSLCLNRMDRDDEALREADEAVRCGPGIAFCHYVRGSALKSKGRLPEAEAAVNEAIQLDPDEANYPGLLASIEMERRNWTKALDAADRGLALDPEHNYCLNLRAMALVQLGRKDEASATLGSALADDPDNALTHANQGWALLHTGEHEQALEHFREALRIDPDLEWARVGIVESLKARFLIYRVMLRFFLWMGRQGAIAQWAVILGFIFGRQALDGLAQSFPALRPLITPILVLSFAFLLMTWISSPLFNITLRFNRFGRLALSDEQRVESNWIGGCFFLAAGLLIARLVTGNPVAFLGMMYFGLLLFPLSVTFRQEPGKSRWIAAAFTGGIALLGAVALASLFVPLPLGEGMSPGKLFMYFVYGSVLSTWLGAFLNRSV